MLNAFHDGNTARIFKTFALAFIGLGVCGLVFLDISGVYTGGARSGTLAKVGRSKISLTDFERVASNAVREQNMSLQEAYRFGMLNNILDEMIQQETLRQWSYRQGLIVGRDQVAAKVHDLIKTQVQPGETPQAALDRILRTQGLNEAQLTQSIRQQEAAQLIHIPLVAAVTYVPHLATEALARFHAERRDIEFFTLTPEGIGHDIKADDATLQSYFESIKDQYQVPEERVFRVMTMDAGNVKESVSISDADVARAYNERAEQFRIGEQRTLEQAVFPDEAAAKTAAELTRGGKSLKSVSGSNYRGSVDAGKDDLPAELSDPAFGAEKGTVLNPIQTPLGWHVIRVADIKPARTLDLNAVRANLRKELESDAMHEEMEARIRNVDEALSNGDTVEQIAQSMNASVKTIGPIDAKGNFAASGNADPVINTLAQNKDLLSTLFDLMEGETAPLAQVSDDVYAIFALDRVVPSREREFSEVRDDVEKRWLAEQRQAALNSAIEKILTRLEKNETTFKAIADEQGATLKTARNVSRESKVAGLNDPVALNRLFDETDLDNVVRVKTEDGILLAKVLDARIPEAGRGNPTSEAEKQWRMQMSQAVLNLFFDDLQKYYRTKINEDLLQKTYGGDAEDASR